MKKQSSKPLLFFLFVLWSITLNSQEKFPKDILLEDFHTFITHLQQTHPDPYSSYGGKPGFMRAVQDARAGIEDSMTVDQFTKILSTLIIPLGDGHTNIWTNKEQSDDSTPEAYLPVLFKMVTDGFFITRTLPDYSSYIGYKLLEINDQSVESLLRKVPSLKPVENKYGAMSALLSMITNQKELTPLIGERSSLQLKLEAPDGTVTLLEVPYQEDRNWIGKDSRLPLKTDNELLHTEMLGDNHEIGYFLWNAMSSREVMEAMGPEVSYYSYMINSIYQYGLKQQRPEDDQEAIEKIPAVYPAFVNLLNEMKSKGSNYLILDLRKNDGGMTPLCLPMLYMLYGDKYLNYQCKAEYNTLLSPLLLKKWGYNSIDEFNERASGYYETGDFLFRELFTTSDKPIEEKRKDLSLITYLGKVGKEYTENLNGEPVYEPHVIVLCSPWTFSAAFHFMYYLQEIGNATIVGVSPSQAGNAFMEATFFELPHTKVSGAISNSIQVLFPDDPERGKVYMPDFPMSWTEYQAYDFDPDAEILYVLDLIKTGKINRK